MWNLHVLPMFAWVSSGCSGFPHHQNMYISLFSDPWLRYWLRIWSWSALWLLTAPQGWVKCREHISLYAVYVTNNVPLEKKYWQQHCLSRTISILWYWVTGTDRLPVMICPRYPSLIKFIPAVNHLCWDAWPLAVTEDSSLLPLFPLL